MVVAERGQWEITKKGRKLVILSTERLEKLIFNNKAVNNKVTLLYGKVVLR